MRDYQTVFLKAAFNSLLPEFMDSDRLTADSLSPELLAVLRKIGDHYYKDDATTAAHIRKYEAAGKTREARALRASQLDYRLVNDFFGTGSFFKDFEDQGFSTDLKMILGTFVIKRDGEGYRITDKYDFSSNPSFVMEYLDEMGEVMQDQGNDVGFVTQFKAAVRKSAMNKDKGMMGRVYPYLRVLGNQFAPDTVSPEEGGAKYVDIYIPSEDEVEANRPAPRPTWFEDENIPPVFPATPMDEERKGLLDTALNALFPPAEAGQLDKDFEKNMMDLGIATPSELEGIRLNRPDEYQQLYNRYLQNIEVPPTKTSEMSLPTSKPTAKERRVASAQDQDFSDASA